MNFCALDNPLTWTLHPFLPITRKDELGILVDWRVCKITGYDFVVFLCNIFDIGTKYVTPQSMIDNCPQKRYNSYAEIIAYGWRVD